MFAALVDPAKIEGWFGWPAEVEPRAGGRTHLTFVQSGYGGELDSAARHGGGWFAGLAELKRMHALGGAWSPVTSELPSGEEQGV